MAEALRDVDDPSRRIPIHRQLIDSKPLLRASYLQWYRELVPADVHSAHLGGDIVEVGCGPSFLEELIPTLVKTDCVPNPYAQRIVDAMQMDYPDSSLRAICALGVVHHLPEPSRFFAEAQRCLKPGGRLAILEPSHQYPVPGFPKRLFALLDHYEYFDATVDSWVNTRADNMSGANLALPWVIFERDRARFQAAFPDLRVLEVHYHSPLSHFLAGAFALRSLVPPAGVPAVFAAERVLARVAPRLGAMMTVHIEKSDRRGGDTATPPHAPGAPADN